MSVEAVSRLVSRPAGVSRGRCHKHPSNHGYMTKINSPILGLAWKGAPIAKLVWGHLPHLGYMLRVSGGPRATVCGMAGRGGARVVGFSDV